MVQDISSIQVFNQSEAAARALKPLSTGSVSRGFSIALPTRETISFSISIRLFLFMMRLFFER